MAGPYQVRGEQVEQVATEEKDPVIDKITPGHAG
jgi:hypothetical protein